jgi:CHAT domain-containing protein
LKTLIIEIYKDAAQWKMSAFYKGESMGHRQYSICKVSEQGIRDLCSDIFNILDRVDSNGKVTANSLEDLRKSSQLLYDQVLSSEVKNEIRRTDATHLIFYIDEQLVHIPWELLYDGKNYLSLRFAIGRVVLTARKIHTETSRTTPPKLKMLAICDPTGDLKSAYEEGITIRNELDRAKKKIQLDLRTTDVSPKFVMKNIREYDVFHFAGHAKYDKAEPSKSGLILKDGNLTAGEIASLSGSHSMPLLVFANACSSGETEPWRIEAEQQNRIYGLANTFLLAGVKHYIGTFWKVQDKLCMDFAKIFYHNIRQNKSIGEALRSARLKSIEKYGQSALIWASYMLYGDPDEQPLSLAEKEVAADRYLRRTPNINIGRHISL